MAFLDNSGDIILDAVLTDTGRRKMANGTFRIKSFALGDDEIDYSLYNKNHPSGSAYYDLEILQTPIFEATTQTHAGINYGLMETTATDLLYLPTFHVNALAALQDKGAVTGSNGMYYVTDTSNDITSATISDILTNRTLGEIKHMGGTSAATNFVLMESGLATGWDAVPVGSEANRSTYLVANELVENGVYVFYDNRFFDGVMGLGSGAKFAAQGSTTSIELGTGMTEASTSTISTGLDNYSAAAVGAIANAVYRSSSPNTEQTYSVISGPRANAFVISPIIKTGLDAEYARYGTLNHTIVASGTSHTTRYIDTTIYVQGVLTPGTLQIPIRIIRRG
jgi:hypothetical protein